VVLLDVLHYLPGPAQERLLARAAGVLRPGGLLLLRDPDPSAGLRFALAAAHERVFLRFGLTRGGRGRYRSGREWAGLLGELGLRADVRPLSPRSPYADRIVTGRRP
jgi:SAM-dependent methyltransferase